MKPCTTPECDSATGRRVRGMCNACYLRLRRHGDPAAGHTRKGAPLAYYLAHINDQTDDCVLWPFALAGSNGYGQVKVAGKAEKVHRMACEHHHGLQPPGTVASHGPCHTPACFNGRHLSWQTRSEDAIDRVRDGTVMSGERHKMAKFTWPQVRQIRARHASGGITQAKIADEFGVSEQAISMIIRGNTWRETTAAQVESR